MCHYNLVDRTHDPPCITMLVPEDTIKLESRSVIMTDAQFEEVVDNEETNRTLIIELEAAHAKIKKLEESVGV